MHSSVGDYRNSEDGKHYNWGDEKGHERRRDKRVFDTKRMVCFYIF